jgi:hypothetical protein
VFNSKGAGQHGRCTCLTSHGTCLIGAGSLNMRMLAYTLSTIRKTISAASAGWVWSWNSTAERLRVQPRQPEEEATLTNLST